MSTLEERFWAKVDKTETCWLWTASLTSVGYGQININKRPIGAHRVALELTGSQIPEGMQVDHMCHVRRCVRPDHLQIVSHQVNQENRTGATRANLTGIRGVGWHQKSGKWRVFAASKGKYHHGGMFTNLADAEAAAISLRNRIMSNNLADAR